MLVLIASFLDDYIGFFRIFSYSTFRAVIGSLTSLFICLFLGPVVIRKLKSLKVGQVIRNDGPQSHLSKTGTPTMGGVLIIISITISSLLWVKLNNIYLWLLLIIMLSVGALGFYDDWKKIVHNDPDGVSGKMKILCQSIAAIFVGFYLYVLNGDNILLFSVPFFKNFAYPLGIFGFLILTYFVIVGTSNAVNLTDGLDGLTTLPIVFVTLGLSIFAYASGNIEFSRYLQIQYIPGVNEVMIFGAIICGACLGFLWWNAHPAEVFMGDVGSLSLGAVLGTIAVIVRQEIILFIMGFIFVLEAVSVILQVGYYKLTKKRIFLMAPLHHHFEQKGWSETKVVVRFWIISIILMLIGLATLKIR